MDSYPSVLPELNNAGLPPILIAASSDAAAAKAARTIEAAGFRTAARLPIEQALSRIEQQASATAVWVELDRDCGEAGDVLLSQVQRDVAAGRYGAVVAMPADQVDAVVASVGDTHVELVVDGSDGDRSAALALACAWAEMPLRVQDVAGDKDAARLRQLSDEVSRIAATLARLSAGPSAPASVIEPRRTGDEDVPPIAPETVRAVIRARRLRTRYFPDEIFADPAWDMLLDLLQAEISHLRVPVSSLCIAAAVPATTALRWLKSLVAQGLFIRRADPHDGRRVFVELAPDTSTALRRYFAEVGSVAVI